jgi:ribosomal protein L4
VVEAKDLNTYDVLSAKYVVMTKKAVEIVEDRLKEGDEE